MTQFESRIEEVEASGSHLVFVAAEKRDGVWKPGTFLKKRPIKSLFLLDEDRTVTKAYGLHHALSTDALNIAHPATLIIGGNKTLLYIYRGDNQHDRAPVDEVIAALQSLSSS
jgi:peroxiredoxin